MAVNPCLAHSQKWRSDFQCVLNSIQKKGTLMMPLKHVKRVGRHVCTCDLDDDDDDSENISEEAFAEIQTLKTFYSSLSPEQKTKLGKAQPILLRLVEDIAAEATGKVLFLNIIRDALENNYNRLGQVVKKTNLESEGGEKPNEWITEVVSLPLAVSYVGLLIGKGGQRIKTISETYKCQIHIKDVDKRHPHNYNATLKEIDVSLRWKLEETERIPLLKEHLKSVVKLILLKRSKHDKAVQDYAAIRRKRVMKPSASTGAGFKRYGPADTNFKALNEKQFERHHSSHLKSSKERSQGKKDEPSILEGCRCYFCSTLYPKKKRVSVVSCGSESEGEEEEEEDEQEDEELPNIYAEDACCYHSGYLVVSLNCDTKQSAKPRSHKWTCCSEILLGLITDDTKQESHESSGCVRGRHLWHPNRKSSIERTRKWQRSSRAKGEEEDFTVN